MSGSATCVASQTTSSLARSMACEGTVKDSGPAGSGSSLPYRHRLEETTQSHGFTIALLQEKIADFIFAVLAGLRT